MTARRIAHRLVFLTFNAAPPAGLTLSSFLLDLISSPKAEEYIHALRRECEQVLEETSEGYWTKTAVEKLILLDSALRESMRLSDFGSHAFPRRVRSCHSPHIL